MIRNPSQTEEEHKIILGRIHDIEDAQNVNDREESPENVSSDDSEWRRNVELQASAQNINMDEDSPKLNIRQSVDDENPF